MSLKQEMGFAEGFIIGADRVQAALDRGERKKVFDWLRAAQLIKERQPTVASAGLAEDWNNTGGVIFREGAPANDYAYLASMWATPLLDMDGEEVECFLFEDETEYDSGTKWPEEALAILES